MSKQEPPPARTSLFFIGKDSRGHWVVQDQQHRCGGLFVDRTEALRYALFENGNRPQAVVMVPGVFELDLTGTASVGPPPAVHPHAVRRQEAAGHLAFKAA